MEAGHPAFQGTFKKDINIMMDWVKEKLEKINKLYPSERISKSKERWTKLWRGDMSLDRYPYTYGHLSINYQLTPPSPDGYENRLRECLNEIIIRGIGNDDYIPSIPSGSNVSLLANMFGAEEIVNGDDHSNERILDNPEDIDKIKDPSILPGSLADDIFKFQEYLIEETDGLMPIRTFNMQGPSEIPGMLFGYDKSYYCAIDDPNRFHVLMSKVTDAFIMFAKKQRELVGDLLIRTNLWDWDWAPNDLGVTCNSDTIILSSPDFYDEFYKPYIVRIGEIFGGTMLHSCGNYPQLIEKMTNTPYVKGLNSTQMRIQDIVNAGANKDVVLSLGGTMFYPTVDKIEEGYDFIKKNNLKAYLTFLYHWPRIWRDGRTILPWDKDDMKRMKETEERIHKAVTI